MNFLKTFLFFVIASAALAGVASASSLYTSSASNNTGVTQQMANVIAKNSEAVNHQF
ncbi:hypothetical protein [Limosilactobacillus sp.]|uniref:hypothetical protein n=1 Tax=Limosilactobacillus sp. TaxID=2773925 RepID=UPI003F0CCDE1